MSLPLLALASEQQDVAAVEVTAAHSRYQLACEDLISALMARAPHFRGPFEISTSSRLQPELKTALGKYRIPFCYQGGCAGEKLELSIFAEGGMTVLCLRTLNLTLSRGYVLRHRNLIPLTGLSLGIIE